MVDAAVGGRPVGGRPVAAGGVAVRFATGDDADAIVDLCRELLGFYGMHPPGNRPAMIAALRDQALGPGPKAIEILLAEVDEEPMGLLAFHQTFAVAVCQRSLFIQDLYVLERARGLGLGRALMMALAAEAGRRGATQIDWTTDPWNEVARRFYDELAPMLTSEKLFYRLAGNGLRTLLK